jgi:glutamate carboxypeptidase
VRGEFGAGPEQLLILGHLDTVWPVGQTATMPIRIEDGRLYGPGVYDMKAGIGLALAAVRVLTRLAAPVPWRIVLLFTSDEEVGSRSGRPLLEAEARRSQAVLVPEPPLPDGGLKTARKAVGEFVIEARGVAAHAGVQPEAGASAVLEIAHQIVALHALAGHEPGLTVNAGVVSGGTRSNVIAPHARAEVDVRAVTAGQAERVARILAERQPIVPRVQVEVTGGFHRPPLGRTAAVVRLYELARDVAAGLGEDLTEGSSGGGSDGSFTAALGVPTLDGLGAPGDGAHALHEHVLVDALAWRTALLAGLMLRIPLEKAGG